MEIATTSAERSNHDAEPKTSYKSWKKKYRKLRHKFEGVMKRSDELFKQDLIATATIKRVTEENNRLLDLLLELNANPRINVKHRQNIGTPSSLTPPRMMTPETLEAFKTRKFFIDDENGDEIVQTVHERKALPDVDPTAEAEPMDLDNVGAPVATANGTQDTPADESNPTYTVNGVQHDPSKPLTPNSQPVEIIRRREIPAPEEPDYIRGSTPPRFRETSPFLNPIEDEELPPGTIIHYHEKDGFSAPAIPQPSPTHSKFPSATNASIPAAATEEEHHWPRNPMSVYCWLRKYQPQVFLQDNEAPGGKERKKKGKRAAVDDEDEEHEHGATSPHHSKPKRGGTRMSFAGGEAAGAVGGSSSAAGVPSEGKATAGVKRRRAAKDEGAEETPEKEKGPGRGKSSSSKPPAAKKPRKSAGIKREDD